MKFLLASAEPRDMALMSQAQHYEALVNRLATLARFIILDMGNGLPSFIQKTLLMCNECIVVVEGVSGTIQHTRLLLDDIASLKVDQDKISVVLNNRTRSEAQMPMSQVQEKHGTFHFRHADPGPGGIYTGGTPANACGDMPANEHDVPTISQDCGCGYRA